MTFIPQQTFDEDGAVQLLKTIERTFIAEADDDSTADNVVKGKLKTNFKTEAYTADDAVSFQSLEDAEAYALTEGNVFWGMSAPPIRHIEQKNQSGQRISNAMSNIATKTKRHGGNTVVYHPDFAEAIAEAKVATKIVKQPIPGPNYESDKSDVRFVDVDVPYFNDPDSIEWIEHSGAPKDKVLVMYRGTEDSDQPLVYVDGAGLILNNRHTTVEYYGKFTKVT